MSARNTRPGAEPPKTAPRGRRKPRRRQEDRSAETRAKVIRAATDCVAELGFRGATMATIAERAGVTWGAIQHQFREKGAILDAVMEASLDDLEEQLAELREGEPIVSFRVQAFVRRARELVRGPSYRAFVEIQLNRARDEQRDGSAESRWSQHVADSLTRAWRRAFGDLGIPAARLLAGQRFAFMVLSGIAAEAILFPEVDFSKEHLSELEASLLRMYSDA
jgi:AcrR family transcriptional regulator